MRCAHGRWRTGRKGKQDGARHAAGRRHGEHGVDRGGPGDDATERAPHDRGQPEGRREHTLSCGAEATRRTSRDEPHAAGEQQAVPQALERRDRDEEAGVRRGGGEPRTDGVGRGAEEQDGTRADPFGQPAVAEHHRHLNSGPDGPDHTDELG